MKIVIEIREKSYENLQAFKDKDLSRPEIAVKYGIPLPKGYWIKEQGRIYKCSNCRNILDFDGVNAGRGDANYCPNCGAKMEEGL